MHVGEGLDNFISGGHVIDLDEGLPHSYIDRQTPRGQHQTTAVVGGGVVASPPRPLSAPEQAVYDATRAEAQRTGAIFDAVRAKNGSRFSPGKRRRSMGVFRRHDGAFYAGQPPSFAQSFREFQKLDRERQVCCSTASFRASGNPRVCSCPTMFIVFALVCGLGRKLHVFFVFLFSAENEKRNAKSRKHTSDVAS